MSNPYYSPSRKLDHAQQRDRVRVEGNSPPRTMPTSSAPMQDYEHPRQGTGGPGNASQYYSSQDAPLGGDVPAFGTGTDGFGGTDSYEEASGRGRQSIPYAQDYRHDYMQRGGDRHNEQTPQQYHQPSYHTPTYDTTPQQSTMALSETSRQYPQHPAPYDQQYLHQYPPQNSFTPSPGPYDQRVYMGGIDRPGSPGIYPDRAPNMDKLNDEQKKIAKEFPKDLDEKNGSMVKNAVASIKDWRTWIKWKYIPYYIIVIVIVLLVAFLTVYHKQIVEWLTPISKKVRSVSWGWIIPVVILFIISFPPLFGHEIVGILLGVVYGLWIGFAVLSLGTLLGEWGNFYAFKHFLKKHAERYERTSLNYACMAYIVREGGFLVILLARLSAIPGHFTTAVFATVGMNFFMFTIATLLSMPKQLVVVYLGVAIESSGSGTESTQSKIIKYVVVFLSTLVTIGVAFYLYGRMLKARPIVQARMQQKRYEMLQEAASSGISNSQSDDSVFAADESTVKLNEAGMYSTEYLQSSHLEQDQEQQKQKSKSRWKWGKKRTPINTSRESLEAGNERSRSTFMMDNGVSMSMENNSMPHFKMGGEERLRGQNVQYVKTSNAARGGQGQEQGTGQWRGQQGEAELPHISSQSAPPTQDGPLHDPYQSRDRATPSTAPPFGPPSYHDGNRGAFQDPLSQQNYDPRMR